MRTIRRSGWGLGLLCLLAGTVFAQANRSHPLDPLNASEVKEALDILRSNHLVSPTTMFPYLLLKEPPKSEVLAFEPGKPYSRRALAILYERDTGKTSEVVVDLRAHKIESNQVKAGVHPSVMLSEFDAVPPIVKADPRFAEAMKRRGITNLDDVAVDVWAYGTPDSEHAEKVRLLRAVAYYKGKHKNFYARPIEGFMAVVNMNERKVEKVVDSEVYPIPPESSDLDESTFGKPRKGLKPMKISQPEGPSYQLNGNEVQWQNWSFRFALHPREGLVLYMVRYNDHGKWRPVLYRASLSDMMVPYGYPDAQHWSWRAAFDEGEYGIGRYSGSLSKGADVPENARLFDALFVDDFGKPYTTRNAVALYERDGGMLWKHFDMYAGGNVARRARELVISFITTISNYDYGLNWVFRQDGSIELEAQLSGIMLAKGTEYVNLQEHHGDSKDLRFGHLIAPNVLAPHHQHFFNFRLDMDVDGTANNVAELDTVSVPKGSENPGLNGFEMIARPLTSEKEAQRDLDFKSQRKWIIQSATAKNSLGYPTGYLLLPGENGSPYLNPDSPLLRRGGFVKHPFWATRQSDDEMHAAGEYPNQRSGSDGLPLWTAQDRSLENQDVVIWYTFAVTHAPRPEEWPVMTAYKTGFKLVPAGFFDRNPSLDVPVK